MTKTYIIYNFVKDKNTITKQIIPIYFKEIPFSNPRPYFTNKSFNTKMLIIPKLPAMKKINLFICVFLFIGIQTQAQSLSVSASVTNNVTCHGGNNGSITSTPSGGTSPYTYSWATTGGTNQTASNLLAGIYTVTVTDHIGHTATASATVTQPTAIRDSISSYVNVSFGATNNGSATVGVNYGTPPYNYLWSPGSQTNTIATGLSAGTYSITITDNSGCTSSISVTILPPAPTSSNWTTNPFDHKVFIQNLGQFHQVATDSILYGAQLGASFVYFTKNKFIYQNTVYDTAGMGKDHDTVNFNARKRIYTTKATWENASTNDTLTADSIVSYKYYYAADTNRTIAANIYRRITYHSLYPGVNLVLTFSSALPGFTSDLIVQPGTSISKIKLFYDTGARSMSINGSGNMLIAGRSDTIEDHAPVCYYLDTNISASVSYVLRGDTEEFTGSISSSYTLVIDPWTTVNPYITGTYNTPFDLDYDNNGNIYVYGGYPFQLATLNSQGTIQGIFNTNTITNFSEEFYGDMAVQKTTGNAFIFEALPANVYRISPTFSLTATVVAPTYAENWRAEYDACHDKIIIGGGGYNSSAVTQGGVLSNLTGTVTLTLTNILGAANTNTNHDFSLVTLDPSGADCYMATCKSYANPATFNNQLYECPLTALLPVVYGTTPAVPDIYGFDESYDRPIDNPKTGWAIGFNGMKATPSWLYLYDGDTLSKYIKGTGVISKSVVVPNPSPFKWSGLDADLCDNIFVADNNNIYEYGSSLSPPVAYYAFPTSTIFDLHIDTRHDAMYVCGGGGSQDQYGFVTSLSYTPASPTLSISTTNGASCCTSTATVTVSCGSSPYTYLWSNGQTNATATGLCNGTYSVTVTLGAFCPAIAIMGTVTISDPNGGPATPVITGPITGCGGMYSVSNVVAGASYSWTTTGATSTPNSGTGSSTSPHTVAFNLNTGGTITFTATKSGCSSTATYTIEPCCTNPAGFNLVIGGENASQIPGGSVINSKTVLINGLLTIDQNTTFDNCDIQLTTGSEINILNGVSLTLGGALIWAPPMYETTRLHAACDMWQGIVIQPGGALGMGDEVVLEDAIQGVLAINLATSPYTQAGFDISEFDMFNKCYQDIVVTSTPNSFNIPTGPGWLTGGLIDLCDFTCRQMPNAIYVAGGWGAYKNYPMTTLLFPYTGIRSHIGIQATGVNYWSDIYDGNFDNMDYGINSTTSSIGIGGCNFNNIVGNGANYGVYATSNAANPSSLQVGSCAFTNCYEGVYATNYMTSVNILYDNFNNTGYTPFAYAIFEGTSNKAGSLLSIEHNTIQNATVGIGISNNINTMAEIGFNSITNSNCTSNNFKGISVTETGNPPNATYNIVKNNPITTENLGIYANGLNGAYINYNTITLEGTTCGSGGPVGMGIECLNMASSQTADNTVTIANTFSSRWSMRGIYETTSPVSDIRCNNINYAGISIQMDAASSAGTTVNVNTLTAGVNPNIGMETTSYAQVVGGSPTIYADNVWSGTFECRSNVVPSIAPKSNIYGPNALTIPCPNPANPQCGTGTCTYFLDPPASGPGTNPCPSAPTHGPEFKQPPRLAGDTLAMDSIIADSLGSRFFYAPNSIAITQMHNIVLKHDTFENQDTMQAIADEGVVRVLWNNLYLLSTDATLNNFMDSIRYTPLGEIMAIDSMIPYETTSTGIAGLLSTLNSFGPNNNIEANMQDVTGLYLSYLMNDSLSSSQLMELRGIAMDCPDIDGPGVLQAAALLPLFDTVGTIYLDTACSHGSHRPERRTTTTSSSTSSLASGINIYPNPNNGNFTLEYNLGTEMEGKVRLYNMLGQVVGEYTLANSQGKMSISNPQLSNGVYIWKLYTNTDLLKFGKVVIMK